MKINKGKISNINEIILVGTASLILVTTSLSGCQAIIEDFQYEVNSEGQYVASGYIDYELLKNYRLIELKCLNKNDLYIVRKNSITERYQQYESYMNILTGKCIYNTLDKETKIQLLNEYPLTDYLINYDMVKSSYTIDELVNLLDKIKQDYNFESSKKLVKSGE